MKYLLTIILIASAHFASCQKYFTKTGKTAFKASVDTFEPIEAENNSTTAILNTSSGEVAALIFVRAFRFKVALMEEHFNENYMDSDNYPKASFKGQIKDFDLNALGDQEKSYVLSGTLTIRGQNQNIETSADMKMVNDQIVVSATFDVQPEKFNIEIPEIVREKIAKNIRIDLNYELKKRG